jgi:O-antigen/teichoic acid export membrane protein
MMDRLRELLRTVREPLYANAYALVANQVLSAGLGLLYWMLAARLYGAVTVGASAAVISTLLLISGIAQLGLGGGMTRFLPRAGRRTRRLILLSYGAVVVVSVVLSLAFVALGGALGLRSVLGDGPLLALWAVLAAVLWSVFRLQDAVLIGLRQAKWVLIENTIYNVTKLLLLAVGVGFLANAGIVGSWFLPTPIVIVLVTWLVFGVYTRADRIAPAPADAQPLTVREIAATSGGDHVGSLVAEAASRLIPLLVVAVLGAAANAYFYQAWLVATTLSLLASGMTDSFTAEAAADRPNISRYSRDILRHMAVLILPAAAILGVGAPLILTLFGKSYAAEGTTLLRWLCLSSPLILFNNWYLAYARVMGRIRQVVWLQVIAAALLLGLSLAFLLPLGITGVGIAWLLSEAVIAAIGLIDSRSVFFGLRPAVGGAG